MNATACVELVRQAFLSAFWLSLPLLAVGFVVGILMSLLQIITSIQDPAFSTIPRLVGYLIAILGLMPWMLNFITAYSTGLLGDFSRYAR
jgi:flagellar biosynthetic protein FliQ